MLRVLVSAPNRLRSEKMQTRRGLRGFSPLSADLTMCKCPAHILRQLNHRRAPNHLIVVVPRGGERHVRCCRCRAMSPSPSNTTERTLHMYAPPRVRRPLVVTREHCARVIIAQHVPFGFVMRCRLADRRRVSCVWRPPPAYGIIISKCSAPAQSRRAQQQQKTL